MKKNWIVVTRVNGENRSHSEPMTWNEARHELRMCYEYATSNDWREEYWLCEAEDTNPTEPYDYRYSYSAYSKFYN